MTLQELRYLAAVADTRNFSRAADQCFVTQPTLSTQLKKLEDHLGVQLVERTNKTVRLTSVGQKVVDRARRVLDECGAIEELTQSYGDPYAEPFRIGIIATLGPYLLPRLLPELQKSFPQLKLIIQEGLTEDLVKRIRSHELDCALLALPIDRAGLTSAVLFEEPFWFVCQRGHHLAGRRRVRKCDLAGETVLLLAEGHCLRDHAMALCGPQQDSGIEREESYRATSLETLRHLVAAGFGCTLLPTLALNGEGASDSPVKAIPFESPDAGRSIGLVWRKSYPRGAALLEITRFIGIRSAEWLRDPLGNSKPQTPNFKLQRRSRQEVGSRIPGI